MTAAGEKDAAFDSRYSPNNRLSEFCIVVHNSGGWLGNPQN